MDTLPGTAQPKEKAREAKEEAKEEEKEEVREEVKEEETAMDQPMGRKGSAKVVERTGYHNLEGASYVADPTTRTHAHRQLLRGRAKA